MKYNLTPEQRERIVKWCEALEGGNYTQRTGCLRSMNEFCCLGVACDVSRLDKWDERGRYFNDDDYMPQEVADWYGIEDRDPVVTINGVTDEISTHNDEHKATFPQIAAAIREQILGGQP